MAGKSPTENSLSSLRAQGYVCWVVEYYNYFRKQRVDLFGCIDIIAIRKDETLAVQTTTSGVAARVKKITDSEYLPAMRDAGWRIEVHGWRLAPKTRGGKVRIWKQRVVDLS